MQSLFQPRCWSIAEGSIAQRCLIQAATLNHCMHVNSLTIEPISWSGPLLYMHRRYYQWSELLMVRLKL